MFNIIVNKIKYSKYELRNIINFIKYPIIYLRSFIKVNSDKDIGVVMCVYNEDDNIINALESLYKYVKKYYIIDKNGRMLSYIKNFKDNHSDFNYYYEVCPRLNLLESRLYAINLVKEKWVLIQDGDEIFVKPEKLNNLMCHNNICYQTRMKVEDNFIQPYHYFFYSNKELMFFKPYKDVPKYKGRIIRLEEIIKNNKSLNKNPDRLIYRKYLSSYQRSGLRCSIEEYLRMVNNDN